MDATRKILHLDLDAFFCAVEELRDPSLRGKPFAVGGRPEERGVVASCSYPARKFGVRSAMPMSQAVRICPGLLIVSKKFGDYQAASRKVMAVLNDLTPLVEQLSIDEAFLDVTGLPDSAGEIGKQLQKRINLECGLPCSLGVAANKLVAKIANNIGKANARSGEPPNAMMIVPPGEEASFLAPLPVQELWGVGPKTAEALAKMGVHTIADLRTIPEKDLVRRFGKHGAELYERSRGIDTRPVETEHETKSISREITYDHDVTRSETLIRTLREMSDDVGRTLRKEQLKGHTVKIKLRWADFTTLTRQTKLPQPTDNNDVIFAAAQTLLEKNWPRQKPVRLLGVGVSGFENEVYQLGLWEQAPPVSDALQSALDQLHDRFGDDSVRRGSTLKDES